MVDPINKKRSEILETKEEEKPEGAGAAGAPTPGLPPGIQLPGFPGGKGK